ncbi:MAG TPA: methyltransferase domain-containing protein [Longimicrobiales bacterium]
MRPCAGIVICPVCAGPLTEDDRTLRCPQRHAFDRAREGYVHLLPTGHGRSRVRGDTAEMLRARRRFLEQGHFEPLASSIAAATRHHAAARPRENSATTVLEAGCGEGYYIGYLAARLRNTGPAPCFIGVDVSRDALRLAARAHRDVLFLVNDVKHRICVADASIDVLIDVFAPRNPAEFARIARPDGLLLVAIPTAEHLKELRAELPLLGLEEAKRERTVERLRPQFELRGEDTLTYSVELDTGVVLDLLRMTPNYWHLPEEALAQIATRERRVVTVDVRLLHFRRAPT